MKTYTIWGLLNRDIKVLTYRNNKTELMKKLTTSHNFGGVELKLFNELLEKIANSKGIPFPLGDLTQSIRTYLDGIVIELPWDDD